MTHSLQELTERLHELSQETPTQLGDECLSGNTVGLREGIDVTLQAVHKIIDLLQDTYQSLDKSAAERLVD